MSLLVVGSVALDTIKTPFGEVKDALGGSATYFSYAASFFTKVRMVGVVGDDFSRSHIKLLRARDIDTDGIEIVPGGKTFRWSGSYEFDLNSAKTLSTHLNVFEKFQPKLPQHFRDSEFLFLANIDPDLQQHVLTQVKRPRLVGADSMNLWIQIKRKSLLALLSKIEVFIINEGEARMLTEQVSLIKAGRILLDYGPKHVVIKKGEHGSLLFSEGRVFSAPAYPLEEVSDPTGAGDSYAGGFFGYVAKTRRFDEASLRKAVVYGTVMASFNVEDFSLNRFKKLTPPEINKRYKELEKLSKF